MPGDSWRKASDVCSTGEKVARKPKLEKSEAGRGSDFLVFFVFL